MVNSGAKNVIGPLDSTLLGFVGDIFIDRDEPARAFDLVSDTLRLFDYRFANLESIYTDDPHFAPSAPIPGWVATTNIPGMTLPHLFDVVSLAHNHAVDAGHKALLDTLSILNTNNILTCGAGVDIGAAREPAIFSTNGKSIATLGYASVFPHGYEARRNWPGIAPMRSLNIYQGTLNYWIPGERPTISACLFAEDLELMQRDIERAKQKADIVITSFHWGDWTRKFHVTEHERRVGHLAIDAGANIVIGHHQHALRGIEWYKGCPIFYGLGHFVFDLKNGDESAEYFGAWTGDQASYGTLSVRPGMHSAFPFHPDMRMTMIAFCKIDAQGIRAGFVPCFIDATNTPVALAAKDSEFQEVLEYMDEATKYIESTTQYEVSKLLANGTVDCVSAKS